MNMLSLAWRGLWRNRRRTLVTVVAIVLGFAAISLFAGYTHNIYRGLSLQAIHFELLGHLTLTKRGMNKEGRLDPERYLLTSDEVANISALIQAEPHVRLVTPRLAISGIISNGRASTIFIAEGIDPVQASQLQQGVSQEWRDELAGEFGRSGVHALDPQRIETAALGKGLSEMLHLNKGDTAAVLSNTLSGQANALDLAVGGVFDTGNAGTNDKFAFVSLALARSLYDAEGRADRLTVLLNDVEQTDPMRQRLAAKLAAAGYDLEIQTWAELSAFYSQVRQMFDMIFGFIFSIVLTVVVMSVANSMGMTVVERTREIGTLRAIGLRCQGVVRLFVTEACLLTLLGCSGGLLLTAAVRKAVNAAHISYVPPNESTPVPLLVDMDYERIGFTWLLLCIVGLLAAWWPARRAAKQPIIDSLGHV